MKKVKTNIFDSAAKLFALLFFILNSTSLFSATNKFTLTQSSSYYVTPDTWPVAPKGGDTIFVASDRTKALRFQLLNGEPGNPIVVINTGGQVNIDSPNAWGAITFENCKHIKITGNGHLNYKYGFVLSAANCGLAFSELSSDCEAGFIKISHDGFFGIFAKKDYNGKPPTPAPVFSNLVIHDCFIENVTEGMYLGETKSPGMEFKHVKIYNNIVRNTKRESIQIANMVEDVEIYNNTLLNAGQANEEYQNNILQIGDNSVAAVYNNILVGAPKCGIITMGKGNNSFENNYISSCKGIFVDNRLFTDGDAPVTIAGNYFHNNSPTEIIKNMNELNPLTISENVWNTELPFYNNASGNSDNFTLINNRKTMVRQVVFTDSENGNYALAEGNDIKYSSIGAPGGPEILGETKSAENPAVPESKQIMLNKDMLTDEVSGGSYWTPGYLVDEQTLSPEIGQHPVSQSWKPYWNMTKGPYHVIIDLKADYNITAIHLHDMHNTQNLEVSAGSPGNWQPLFMEPCDKFNAWKTHETNITARYIRLSMVEGVYAAINEIAVFGSVAEVENRLKSAMTAKSSPAESIGFDQKTTGFRIIQNPVQNNLRILLPEEMASDFTVDIFNLQGVKILSKHVYESLRSMEFNISLPSMNMANGVYIVNYSNFNGIKKTLKFLKTN